VRISEINVKTINLGRVDKSVLINEFYMLLRSFHRCKKRFLRFLFFPRFYVFNVLIFAKVFYYKKRWQNKNIDFMKPAE
jgi:hypothetical protein